MNNIFLTAAASYYGLNPDTTEVEWQNVNGEFVFAFQVRATADDLKGVLSRMKTIEDAEAQKQTPPQAAQGFSDDDIRKHYDNLTTSQRSLYGSFGRFKSAVMQGISPTPERQVLHVDAPEDSEPVSMDAVWLWEHQATEVQRRFASDARAAGNGRQYLIQSAMLTEEQKAQVADSSGGLPG